MEQRQLQDSYGKYQVNQLNSNSKSFRGAPTMNDELSQHSPGIYSQSKLQLPLIFVKMNEDADIDILMDQDRQNLKISSNKIMTFLNENHLFEIMGLTDTNEEELNELFSSEITKYLKE